MQAKAEVTTRHEWGLKLPDGTEIWPPETFHGRALNTPEDRKVVVDALRASSANMGFGKSDRLLAEYQWVGREVQIITVERPLESAMWPITDPIALPEADGEDAAPEVVQSDA